MNSTFCEFIVKEFEKKDSNWYSFILFTLSFSIANREGLRVQRFEGSNSRSQIEIQTEVFA